MFIDIQYINPTYIVNSEATLNAWANGTSGNDYTSVLIKGPISLSSSSDPVIDLIARGTRLVTGYGGTSIISTSGGHTPILKNGANCQIRDVILKGGRGFSSCNNLIGCLCDAGRDTNSAFSECTNLINCCVIYTGADGESRGFQECRNLLNCFAIGNTGSRFGAYPFDSCNFLTNCSTDIKCTGYRSVVCFRDCKDLTNCHASCTYDNTAADMEGFSRCTNLMNCQVSALDFPSDYYGGSLYDYYRCTNMMFCITSRKITYSHANRQGVYNTLNKQISGDANQNGTYNWALTQSGGWNSITT